MAARLISKSRYKPSIDDSPNTNTRTLVQGTPAYRQEKWYHPQWQGLQPCFWRQRTLMDTEQDIWFPLAVLVSVIAVFMWAASSIGHSDSGWMLWIAGTVIVVAGGSVAVRAWLRANGAVPTEPSQDTRLLDVRRESIRSSWQSVHMALFSTGVVGVMALEDHGWLPGWAAGILIAVLLVGWIWVRGRFRRRTG